MHPEDKLSTTTSSPTRIKHPSALRPGRTATFTMISGLPSGWDQGGGGGEGAHREDIWRRHTSYVTIDITM